MLDCRCDEPKLYNAANQPRRMLEKMQNPVVVAYTGNTSSMVWSGAVTNLPYIFGGSTTQQCVDERDVAALTKIMTNAGQPLFVVVRHAEQPAPEGEQPAPEGEQMEIDRLATLQGVGQKTAKKLVQAGLRWDVLADLDIENEEQVTQLVEETGLNRPHILFAANGVQQAESENA